MPVTTDGRLKSDRTKDMELLDSCTKFHFFKELEELQPELIVAMGAFACRALDPDISLDMHHGIPVETKYGTVFPMWHPAGGIHEPKKMREIRTDWIRLGKYLKGTLRVPQDLHPKPDYRELEDESEFKSIDPSEDMACDTESSKLLGPYCLTYSTRAGSGRLIRASRPDLLWGFQGVIRKHSGHVLFHNWMYDRGICERMGLTFSKWTHPRYDGPNFPSWKSTSRTQAILV